MQRPENKDKRLRGGILIQDDFGNWVYSPYPLDLINGTADIDNWKVFDPQQYL